MSVWAQWHPYALSTGEHWDDIADREADRGRGEQVERGGAGLHRGTVEHVHVQTPLDLERELGLLRRQRHARRDGAGLDVRLPAAARAGGLPCAGCAGCSSPVRPPTRAAACSGPPGVPRHGWCCATAAPEVSRRGAYGVRAAGSRPVSAGRGAVAAGWRTTVAARDRLPARRRSVRATASPSRPWCSAPRPASSHAAVHRGRRLGGEAAGAHGGLRAGGRGGRRAHRAAVRRLLATPTRSARRCSTCRWSIPLAWTMMAYPVLLAARRLTRRWVALVGASRPGRLGPLPRPADGRRRALDAGPTRPRRCPACPASR